MSDLNNGLLQINLSQKMINELYEIIYGKPPENEDESYEYIYNSNYYFFENYKAVYVYYQNSVGLYAVLSVNERTSEVLSYINKLITDLATQPDFWSKIANGIRKHKFTFEPKIIESITTNEEGAITKIIRKQASTQDYRVYAIDAVNSFTNKDVFPTKDVSEVKRATRVLSTQYKSAIAGYLDPSIFGGITRTFAYFDNEFDVSSGIETGKIKYKTVKPGKEQYKLLLRKNGYVFKSDLKILLQPDFFKKTFTGALYMDVKNVGYKLISSFSNTSS